MNLRKMRKITQISVFVAMFIIPFLNLLGIYFIKGTFISMDIGSLGIADPVMIFQAVLSSTSAAGVLFASIIIPLLVVILLGRVWCSWACPYTLMLQWLEKVPYVKKRMMANKDKAKRPTDTKIIKYVIFIMLFAIVGVAGVPILHLFSPPAVISSEALLLIKTFAISIEIVFIVILLIIEIFFSYRFACRYFCPTGSCLLLFQNKHGLHVSYSGNCLNCGICAQVCPMVLDPVKEAADRLCFNCGECIEACIDKNKPLKWSIGKD